MAFSTLPALDLVNREERARLVVVTRDREPTRLGNQFHLCCLVAISNDSFQRISKAWQHCSTPTGWRRWWKQHLQRKFNPTNVIGLAIQFWFLPFFFNYCSFLNDLSSTLFVSHHFICLYQLMFIWNKSEWNSWTSRSGEMGLLDLYRRVGMRCYWSAGLICHVWQYIKFHQRSAISVRVHYLEYWQLQRASFSDTELHCRILGTVSINHWYEVRSRTNANDAVTFLSNIISQKNHLDYFCNQSFFIHPRKSSWTTKGSNNRPSPSEINKVHPICQHGPLLEQFRTPKICEVSRLCKASSQQACPTMQTPLNLVRHIISQDWTHTYSIDQPQCS